MMDHDERDADAPEGRLDALGVPLPDAVPAVAEYLPVLVDDGLAWVSGHASTRRGVVGGDLTAEEGRRAAREAALGALASLGHALGGLGRVDRVVRVTGYVRSAPDFDGQPEVVNGASELLVAAFGESGRHARAAIGVNALPMGVAVEVELVARVRPAGPEDGR